MDTPITSPHACVSIPWRRADDPSKIGYYVQDERGDNAEYYLKSANRTVGTVCFKLTENGDGSGLYAIYWLPYHFAFSGGSGSFRSHFANASNAGTRLTPPLPTHTMDAKFVELQSFSDFDKRSPLELMASEAVRVHAKVDALHYCIRCMHLSYTNACVCYSAGKPNHSRVNVSQSCRRWRPWC